MTVIAETQISYHRGEVVGTAVIVAVLPTVDGRKAVVSNATSFHPGEHSRGQQAMLEVDPERRVLLSTAHTGCHLVAYAFNQATDELWTKLAPHDPRGNRNFDTTAPIDSRHHVGGSVDRYRLGSFLRRRGFDPARLLANLDSYVATHVSSLSEIDSVVIAADYEKDAKGLRLVAASAPRA